MKKTSITLAGAFLLPLLGFAEPATIGKTDNLRARPFTDAKVVMALKAGQQVDIQKREGAWYLIKVQTKTGYAPMMSVRRSRKATTASTGSLSNTATGRAATGGVVSTTGVRGLDEENLTTAPFSEEAAAAADKMRVSVPDATAFAAACSLQTHDVPALVSPATGGGR